MEDIRSVLIVDDDETDRYLLKRLLKKAGYDVPVFEKTNGKEALEFFENYEEQRQSDPDAYPPLIVFLDINMPLMDGFQFLETFSQLQNPELESLFFMMFSSSARDEEKEKALEYDFVKDYLVKGNLDVEALEQKVTKLVKTNDPDQ